MIKRIFLLILVIFTSCEIDNSIPITNSYELTRQTPNHGGLPQPFIVGGDVVNPACPDCKYPFMVSIQSGWGGHFCGGSLVREDWGVTAAHCVNNDAPTDLVVKIGLHDQNNTQGSETRNVTQIIIHPNYDSWSLDNDYALLQLSEPSTFQPIKLITDESHDNDGIMTTTMGWGTTSSGGWSSDVLLEVDVPIDDNCGFIGDEITENMICAGDENGGEDSCQGDSGGPLIVEWNNEYELIGIVSWGYGCADAGYPGVYSRIESKKDWFFSYIGEPEIEPIVEVAEIGFGNAQNGSIEITLDNPIPTAGFQFDVVTTNNFTIIGAIGGLAEDLGFSVSTSETGVVVGFSFQGTLIPAGNHVLTNLIFEGENQSEFCLVNGVIDGLDVQYGGCTTVTQNPQAYVSFGDNTISTLDIAIISEVDIAGFQFNIEGVEVVDAFGGLAEENNFTLNLGDNTILGFSFSGDLIPASDGVMVTIQFNGNHLDEVCLTDLVLSNDLGSNVFVETGDCIILDLILPGDLNFDEMVNVVDIVTLVNIILGEPISGPSQFLAADVNGDEVLNILDIVNIVSIVLNTTFSQSVEWLEVNYPQLETKMRLKNLNIDWRKNVQ